MRPHHNQFEHLLLAILTRLPRSNNSGYTLVIAIVTLLILTTLLVTYAVTSKIDNATSVSSAKSNTGFYTAEAGLNTRAQEIRKKFEGFSSPIGTSPGNWKDCLDVNTGNDGTEDFACQVLSSATFNNTNTRDTATNQIGAQRALTFVKEGNNPQSIIIPAGEEYAGLNAQEYRYDVTSVSLDNKSSPTAQLVMRFNNRLIPLFQFAAFYQNDLHFLIPPNMTVNGLIHSNHNVYLDSAPNNTLTISGQVSARELLYRGSKLDPICGGTVNIFDPLSAKTLPCNGSRQSFADSDVIAWNGQVRVGVPELKVPKPETFDAIPGQLYWDSSDLRIALNLNTNTIEVRNQADGVSPTETIKLTNSSCVKNALTTVSANINDKILTLDDATLFKRAGIITLGNSPTLATPGDVNSNTYVLSPDQSGLSNNQIRLTEGLRININTSTPIYRQVVSYSQGSFKNYREKRSNQSAMDNTPIQMLNLDIRGLLECSEGLMGSKLVNDETEGGLVWFLSVKGPNSNTVNDYGVRIYNGADLSSTVNGRTLKGLTIVSDQTVYVQGDYNCFGATCNNGNGNALDDDERKPAAIMADTINILSNAWLLDDSASNAKISTRWSFPKISTFGRRAAETTVNAAFLSGTAITGDVNGTAGQDLGVDTESGGLNNFPRFHEDWSSGFDPNDQSLFVTFHYQGSMVSLDTPKTVNSKFCGTGSTANCNIFNPPFRDWRYDSRFNTAKNLPPMTPRAVFLKQERFSRNFDQASSSYGFPLLAHALPKHLFGQFSLAGKPFQT